MSREPSLSRAVDDVRISSSLIAALSTLRDQFTADSYIELPSCIPTPVWGRLSAETAAVLDRYGRRRDLRLPTTGMSPRKYTLASRDALAQYAPTVVQMYRSRALLALLGTIAGEAVVPVPYIPEEFVATRLERAGDTHGWHWDDYSYALVWMLCSTPYEAGGALEFIADLDWDKSDPQVERYVSERTVARRRPRQGVAYLLRADTTLHRVAPLRRVARREVLIFSYARPSDARRVVKHETLDALYLGQ